MSATRLRIRVTDTGGGIQPDKLKLLFSPFERLGAETTAIEGTGLGLALSRGLAEAMGASLGVESVLHQGSTFWVELALSSEAVEPAPTEQPQTVIHVAEARAATLLYVEDNLSNVRLMTRLLARRPTITLLHAGDGESGVALARERRPDVIFLDLHLPDKSGEDVLQELWADPELRRIPVVMLTADATPAQMRRALASGAAAYLTKPLDLRRVLDTLDQVVLLGEERRASELASAESKEG
jgi:CheY-like chemotaxis protein